MNDKKLRIKKLQYRSIYGGCKEIDLLLGEFAKHYLTNFSDEQLDQYEQILSYNDSDIYNWICGTQPLIENINHDLIKLITLFYKQHAS